MIYYECNNITSKNNQNNIYYLKNISLLKLFLILRETIKYSSIFLYTIDCGLVR